MEKTLHVNLGFLFSISFAKAVGVNIAFKLQKVTGVLYPVPPPVIITQQLPFFEISVDRSAPLWRHIGKGRNINPQGLKNL
jgi:hypothetical protein